MPTATAATASRPQPHTLPPASRLLCLHAALPGGTRRQRRRGHQQAERHRAAAGEADAAVSGAPPPAPAAACTARAAVTAGAGGRGRQPGAGAWLAAAALLRAALCACRTRESWRLPLWPAADPAGTARSPHLSHAQAHLAACDELRASCKFDRLLSHVLAVVNHLNAQHAALRNLPGFRHSSLAKLADTKASDGAGSLLQVGGRCFAVHVCACWRALAFSRRTPFCRTPPRPH